MINDKEIFFVERLIFQKMCRFYSFFLRFIVKIAMRKQNFFCVILWKTEKFHAIHLNILMLRAYFLKGFNFIPK